MKYVMKYNLTPYMEYQPECEGQSIYLELSSNNQGKLTIDLFGLGGDIDFSMDEEDTKLFFASVDAMRQVFESQN